jgi:hypothetical protein
MKAGEGRNNGSSTSAPSSSASVLLASSRSLSPRSSHSDTSRCASCSAEGGTRLPASVLERKSSTALLHLSSVSRSRNMWWEAAWDRKQFCRKRKRAEGRSREVRMETRAGETARGRRTRSKRVRSERMNSEQTRKVWKKNRGRRGRSFLGRVSISRLLPLGNRPGGGSGSCRGPLVDCGRLRRTVKGKGLYIISS